MKVITKQESIDRFNVWLSVMGWDEHGGIKEAAQALGKTPMQIRRWKNGAPIAKDTFLAMTAIAEGLRPWDIETEGLPKVHISLSVDRSA